MSYGADFNDLDRRAAVYWTGSWKVPNRVKCCLTDVSESATPATILFACLDNHRHVLVDVTPNYVDVPLNVA